MFPLKLSTTLLTSIILGTAYFAYNLYARHVQEKRFMQATGSKKAQGQYPCKEPFYGCDITYRVVKAAKAKNLLGFLTSLLESYDYTFTLSSLLGPTIIFTADPENAKAVHKTKFADWSVASARAALRFAIGDSIITRDGVAWSHSRGLMRPIFARDNVANLDLLENHVQAILRRIPKDGSTVDLQPLFLALTLDAATEFVFGQSVHTLSQDQSGSQAQLHVDFEILLGDAINRSRSGKLYPLTKDKRAAAAIRNVRSTARDYVNEALKKITNASNEKSNDATTTKTNYSFLGELAKQTDDVERMVDEAVTLLTAGRDTTATVLCFLWYSLARNPAVWEELVAEVDQLEGALPTYEWIKHTKCLKYCEHEASRLFPAAPLFPPRSANKDTVLPMGGGPDGKQPLFVPKGARIAFNQWTMNRRKDLWGEDAEEFRPNRWEDLKPGWSYIPFGAGPRICLGQEFALTEVYYVTVRLIQHFRRIESRDSGPFIEKLTTSLGSQSGILVGLYAQ